MMSIEREEAEDAILAIIYTYDAKGEYQSVIEGFEAVPRSDNSDLDLI